MAHNIMAPGFQLLFARNKNLMKMMIAQECKYYNFGMRQRNLYELLTFAIIHHFSSPAESVSLLFDDY